MHRAQTRVAIQIPANFSAAIRRRFIEPATTVSEETVAASQISVYPDYSHYFFAVFIDHHLMEGFEKFAQQVAGLLGHNPTSFGAPLEMITPPVYGTYRAAYSDLFSAGMIIFVVHAMNMIIGSFSLVRDRNQGQLERGFVAGIRPTEMLLSNIVFFVIPVLLQVTITLGLALFVIRITMVGSLANVFVLTALEALQGLLFGIFISVVSPSEMTSFVSCSVV